MTITPRLTAMSLLLGLTCAAQADPGQDVARNKLSAKLTVSSVKQQDGSVIERLDLSNKPGAIREDRAPATPEEWLSRMIDPTRNGLILKHPQRFAEWLDAVTEPRFMTALATVALDPNTYPKTFTRMLDPATAQNWAELVDPEIFMRWVAAGMDPRLYQAVFQHMFDPNKYLRWATYPGDPQIEATRARETKQNEWAAGSRSGNVVTAAPEAWVFLPARESVGNPWLFNSNTYRY